MKQTSVVVALILGGILVAGGSFVPLWQGEPTPWHLDKVLHFSVYAMLAFFPALFLRPRTAWFMAVGLIFLGTGVEVLQQLSPSRTASTADAIANIAGVLCGFVMGWWLSPARREKAKKRAG